MNQPLLEQIGIKYPIIQGAMSWVATPSLAAAVSNAGGLGMLGAGHEPGEYVRKIIQETKKMTDEPFGVNVLLLSPYVDEVVDVVCEEGIKVVTTGAGSPGRYMKKFKDAGITVIPVVASVALARRMEKEGADAIICEGMEAGGIADGRGMAAAFMLGASAVQLGTRFVVAYESIAHEKFKERIIKARDIDTVVTGMITGHPVRVLRNKLTKEYLKVEKEITSDENPDFSRLEELGKGALRKAVIEGDKDGGSFMSGQIAGLVSKEQSCEEIIQELMREYKELTAHPVVFN
jgi:enoyl-[acyl-carrier protein] reductase II